MKLYKKISLLLFVSLFVSVSFFIVFRKFETKKTTILGVQSQKANLTAGDKSYDISKYIGKNVLDATISVTNGNTLSTGSGINAFVTAINGRVADSKKHEFWELIINGKSSDVGAGSAIVKNNDKIEWKISTY